MKYFTLCAVFFLQLLVPALSSAQPTSQFTHYIQGGINSAAFTTNNFRCIGVGKGNVIWAGTQYGGLYTYSDVNNIWRKSDKLTNVFINDIKADADSGIWIAQSGTQTMGGTATNLAGGVNYFRQGSDISMNFYSVEGTTTSADLLSRNAKGLYLDTSRRAANGDLPRPWVAQGTYISAGTTRRGGVSVGLNQFAPYFTNLPAGFSGSSNATPIAESVGGNSYEVWLGTRQNGIGSKIMRYKPSGIFIDSFTHLNVPSMFTNGFSAQAIHFDKFNNRWIGLKDGGLRVLTPTLGWVKMDAISFFAPGTQINFNAITSDEYGNVYIGTTSGLLEYQSQEWNPTSSPDYTPSYNYYTTSNGLINNNVTGLAYDKKNGKILITTSGGVTFMNKREPYILGVVFDVFCNPDAAAIPGLQKKPLAGGVRVTLLKDGVEKETTFTNANGIFELKEANDMDNYTVEVRYTAGARPFTYVYNNVRNHTRMDPVLIPDSLIREIKTFKAKMERRSFPIKLGLSVELNSEFFAVDGFNTAGYDLAMEPFAVPITADHKKKVDNLANYYIAMAAVYKLGGDATDLTTDAVANLLDAVESLAAYLEFGVKIKKPATGTRLEQIDGGATTMVVSSIKLMKEMVMWLLKQGSSRFDKFPEAKKLFDRFTTIYGEVADLLITALEENKDAGVNKFLYDNLKKLTSQYIAIDWYRDGYAGDRHKNFVFEASNSAKHAVSPFDYGTVYDNVYNPATNSIAKSSNDTLTHVKAILDNLALTSKMADNAAVVADGATVIGLLPGLQLVGVVCKGISLAAKGIKTAAYFGAMYEGAKGAYEIAELSDKIDDKAGLLRSSGANSEPTGRMMGVADTLMARKNACNQIITDLQAIYAAASYDSLLFIPKFNAYIKADSAYSHELNNTLSAIWSSADSANRQVPGFTTRLTRIVDSFATTASMQRLAMFFQNTGYIITPDKAFFKAGLDSLCREIKLSNDSTVNGIAGLFTTIAANNVPSIAYLSQDGYKINHSRVPGTSGTFTYTFKNHGGAPQNNVSFKISQPTGGYAITSTDSIYIGTINPGQTIQISFTFSSPLADSIGHYNIDVKAANGRYTDVTGTLYTIDPTKVYSVKNGNWNDPTTWSNEMLPTAANHVFIYHEVAVNVDATCKKVTIANPGKVTVKAGKRVNVMQ